MMTMNPETTGDPQSLDVVTATGTPGMLSFLIGSLVSMANNPANTKYFFPLFMQGITIDGGKTLVPFVTEIDMGQVGGLQEEASTILCQNGWAAATFPNYMEAEAANPPTVNLTSATVNGLNNAKITAYQVDPVTSQMAYPVIFTAALNAYSQYSNLSINPGNYFFDVLCQTVNLQYKDDLQATGTFQAQFVSPIFTLVVLVTFNSDLTVSIQIPQSYTPASGAAMPGLQITFGPQGGLTVNNITVTDGGPFVSYYTALINEAFSSQDTTSMIVANLNQVLLGSDVRSAVASAIQTQFNSLISALK